MLKEKYIGIFIMALFIVREGRHIRIILSDNMHAQRKIYWDFYHGIVHSQGRTSY